MATKEVGVRIKVGADGVQNVTELLRELKAAGVETDRFEAEVKGLNAEVARLGREQGLIDQFRRTKQSVADAGAAMNAAQERAQQLGREIAATEEPTKKQERAFARARKEANEAEQAYQQQRLTLQALRGVLGESGIATDQLATAQQRVRQRTDAARQGVNDLVESFTAEAAAARAAASEEERLASIVAASKRELAAAAQQELQAERQAAIEAEQLTQRLASARAEATARAVADFERQAVATQEARTEFVRLEAELQDYRRAVGATGAATDKQVAEFLQLTGATRQAAQSLVQQTQAEDRLAAAARAAGASTEQLNAAQARTVPQLTAVAQAARQAAGGYREQGAAAQQAATQQAAAGAELRDTLTGVQRQLQTLQNLAGAALGGTILTNVIGDVNRTAESYINLGARIRLVTGDGEAFETAFEGVRQIALATNSELEATGTLFGKVAAAGKALGQSQRDALALTQTINQALQLSGGSAEAQQAAVQQLVQGLQSGVLRGEEFNSVNEQGNRIVVALAAGLGVTAGELRKMAEAGQLTSDVVLRALAGQAATIQAEFEQLPPTIGRAITNVKTAFQVYVGEATQSSGASRAAAEAIDFLGRNIDTLAGLLLTAGKAALAYKAIDIGASLIRYSLQAHEAAVATAQSTAATATNTSAKSANAAAAAAAAAAVARGTTAVQADTTALAANTAQQAVNSAAKSRNVVALTEMGLALQGVAASRRAATAADAASVPTTAAATAASTNAARALQAQAAATGGFFSGLTGLVSGAGRVIAGVLGPAGVIAGGVAAVSVLVDVFKSVGTAVGEGAAELLGYGRQLRRNEEQLRINEAAERKLAEAARLLAQQEQLAAERALGLNAQAKQLVAQFDETSKGIGGTSKALEQLQKDLQLDDLRGIQTAGAALDALALKGKITGEQVREALAGALDGQDLAVFEAQARAAFDGTDQGARRLAAALDATLIQVVRRTGISFEELRGGVSAASASAVNDLDRVIQSAEALRAKGLDVDRVLAATLNKALEAATTEKAVDLVRQRLEEAGEKGLLSGDQVAAGLELATDRALKLRQAIEDSTPGMQGLAEAARRAGVDVDLLTTGVTRGFQKGVQEVRDLAIQIDRAGVSAERASPQLSDAIDKRLAAAQTTEEVALLRAETERLGASGKLTGLDYQAALTGIKRKAEELSPAFRQLQRDAELLGVAIGTRAKVGVDEALAAYERYKASGKRTAEEVQAAFVGAAQKIIAANGGIVPEYLKVEAAARNVTIAVDATGKATVTAAGAATQALQGFVAGFDAVGEAIDRAGVKLDVFTAKGIAARNAAIEAASEAARVQYDPVTNLAVSRDGQPVSQLGSTNLQDYTRNLATGALVLRKDAAERLARGEQQVAQQPNPTPVTVVINGRRTTINTATQGDAGQLTELLRQLEAAQRAAGT